ncbi:hypothetical protein CN689_05435 [Peribacillus butanolivorans]|uniref:Transposase n=1 Tax=Peribacillus butanolivorans TaxID=421767 RepID=A0AAX0S7C1_9BACI|nr:hypothetical protein CN689_05435 [Peribacillus butanolivorans]
MKVRYAKRATNKCKNISWVLFLILPLRNGDLFAGLSYWGHLFFQYVNIYILFEQNKSVPK